VAVAEERTKGQLPETPGPPLEPAVEPHWANIPNAFTFLRVLLVPVVLWLLTLDTEAASWWALGVFVFAAVTDSFDGWVARRYNGITRWGQLADPLADKLLVLGALGSLALVGRVWWWAVLVILVREVLVTAMRVRLVTRLRLVLPASRWGKMKTVTQIVAISAYLAPPVAGVVADTLLVVAVAATLGSGIAYVVSVREAATADGS
jgi:CDP-diacylglycerol--glycerol-3-phosphate 3-phosphatidyltransferase